MGDKAKLNFILKIVILVFIFWIALVGNSRATNVREINIPIIGDLFMQKQSVGDEEAEERKKFAKNIILLYNCRLQDFNVDSLEKIAEVDGVITKDLTGLITGSNPGDGTAISHEHIYERKYNETEHWEECFICKQKTNINVHTLKTEGEYTCADEIPPQTTYCTDGCGYNYQETKKTHTPSSILKDPYFFAHTVSCTVCHEHLTNVFAEENRCRDVNGNILGCDTGIYGTCATCGIVYPEGGHGIIHTYDDGGRCEICNKLMFTYNLEKTIVNETTTRCIWNIEIVDNSFKINNFRDVGACAPTLVMDKATYTYEPIKQTGVNKYRAEGTVSYKANAGPLSTDFHINYYMSPNNGYGYLHLGTKVKSDNYAPKVREITQAGSGTEGNFSKKASVTATFTENLDSVVYMALYDSKGNVLADWGTAKNNGNKTFTREFDVVAEIREPETLTVKAKDRCGNEAEGTVELQYIDSKPPEFVSDTEYNQEWSKEKIITFEAVDRGIGNVQMSINNTTDWRETKRDEDTYKGTYRFIGDIYNEVGLIVYMKDELGNLDYKKITVGKLDGTKPTVTNIVQTPIDLESSQIAIESNDMNETLGQEGSGVIGYQITTTLEEPEEFQEENVFTLNLGQTGQYFVWAIDRAGNVSQPMAIDLHEIPVINIDTKGRKLEGSEFEVRNSDGEVVKLGSTNADGRWNIRGLLAGKYTLKQTKQPVTYMKNEDEMQFEITEDGQIIGDVIKEDGTIVVVNEKITAIPGTELTQIKKYRTGTDELLEGAKIGLYDKDKNLIIELVTDSEGKVDFAEEKRLEAGEIYYYKEIEAPETYLLSEEDYRQITVDNDGNVTFEEEQALYNKKITAKPGTSATQITKQKKIGNRETNVKVEGAKIGLYDKDKNLIATLVTDENGKVDFAENDRLEAGETYYYKEIEAPEGYLLSEEDYRRIDVDVNGNVTFADEQILYNNRVLAGEGKAVVIKYRENTEIALEGAKIGLCDEKGNLIKDADGEEIILTTEENGKVDFGKTVMLEPETYYYKEVEAPIGYRLSETIYTFEVDNNGEVSFKKSPNGNVMYNTRIIAQAGSEGTQVTKYRRGTTQGLAGAKIGLYDEDKNLIKELITDENGKVDLAKNNTLEATKTYYYKEIEAPKTYLIDDEEYKQVIVDNNGNVTFPEGKALYDTKITAKPGTDATKITKQKKIGNNKTKTPVEGAKIGLYDKDKKLIATLTTDKDGKVDFAVEDRLEAGENYYYKEIEAPEGYILSKEDYRKIEVDEKGNVTFANEQVLYNDRIVAGEGKAVITKYRSNTKTPLAGVKFALCDKDGKLVKDADKDEVILTTDEKGQIDFGKAVMLEPGTYYYKELEALKCYELDENIYTFEVDNKGEVDFSKNKAGKIVYNTKILAKEGEIVKLKKVKDIETKTPVEGAKIGLYDKDKNLITTLTTGKDGKVDFALTGKLEAGEDYYYKETEAPAGYILSKEDYREITVDELGKVTFKEEQILYNDRVVADESIVTVYIKDSDKPLEGVKIALCDKDGNILKTEDGKEITVTTDNSGQVDFAKVAILEPGEYYYKEIDVPDGYIINKELHTFTVDNSGNIVYDKSGGKLYNEKKPIPTPVPKELPKAGSGVYAGTTIIALMISAGSLVYMYIRDKEINNNAK